MLFAGHFLENGILDSYILDSLLEHCWGKICATHTILIQTPLITSPSLPPSLLRVKYTGLLGLGCVGLLTICDLWQLIADTTIDLVREGGRE